MSQRQRSMQSLVWDHFRKKSASKVGCKHCCVELKYCNNTSNLWAHAKKHNKHKDSCQTGSSGSQLLEPRPADLSAPTAGPSTGGPGPDEAGAGPAKRFKATGAIAESFANIHAFKADGPRTAEINAALMYMVAKDHMPLLTPERPGFKYFLKKVAPLYSPPSRKTFTTMMEDKYKVLASKIKLEIKNLDSYCLTSDIWTNTQTSKSYLGLTVHYYTDGNSMKSATIGVYPLDEGHTADYISGVLQQICQEWDISLEKVSITITDNGENMVKAARDTFGRSKHLPCFAHTINLLAFDALGSKKVNGVMIDNVVGHPPLLNKVKNIVTYFKRSVKASDALRKIQYEKGRTEGTALRLIQAVTTRWNSTYQSIMRFLELRSEICSVLLTLPDAPDMVTGADIESLHQICQLLAPLFQVTEELSAEKLPPASKVIPLLNLMQKKIESIAVTQGTIPYNMKNQLLGKFLVRFGKVEKVRPLAVATMIDPRYKKIHFTDPLAVADTTSFLLSELRSIQQQPDHVTAQGTDTVTSQENTGSSKNAEDLWTIHDSLASSQIETLTVTDETIELRLFMTRQVLNRKQNPYQAWESIRTQFPNLYKVAIRHMSILCTSVPSERLFSEAGLLATDMRNRLTGSHLSMLILLSSIDEIQW